jgi:hypothetical protein
LIFYSFVRIDKSGYIHIGGVVLLSALRGKAVQQSATMLWSHGPKEGRCHRSVFGGIALSFFLAIVCVADSRADSATATGQQDVAGPAKAECPATQFIRIRCADGGEPIVMETAVVSYVSPPGERPAVTVDLVGAIHVGEASYYRKLNELFKNYDALLYELVAPEGTRVPKGGGKGTGAHPVGALQNGMKSMLGLEHQLAAIDYTKENLVHADMTPEEFSRSMKDRGESFTQIFFRMMGQAMAQQSQDPAGTSDIQLLMALFAKDRELRLRRIMARQFEDLEGSMQVFEGPDGSTLISERNKRALAVLADQIKAGKRRIGIFYGAGHLPDMERRLIDQFGLQRGKVRWMEAWDLRN